MLFDHASDLCLRISYWTASFIGANLCEHRGRVLRRVTTNSRETGNWSPGSDSTRVLAGRHGFEVEKVMQRCLTRLMYELGSIRSSIQFFGVVPCAENTFHNRGR